MRQISYPEEFEKLLDSKESFTKDQIREVFETTALAVLHGEKLYFPLARSETDPKADTGEIPQLLMIRRMQKEVIRLLTENGNAVYATLPPSKQEKQSAGQWLPVIGNPCLVVKRSNSDGHKNLSMQVRKPYTVDDHQNLVQEEIHPVEIGNTLRGEITIALNYSHQPTLKQCLDELSEEEKMKILLDVFEALKTLHSKGKVHRDVKSGNIFVFRNPQGCIGRLFDHDVLADRDRIVQNNDENLGVGPRLTGEHYWYIYGKYAAGTHTDVFEAGLMLLEMYCPSSSFTEILLNLFKRMESRISPRLRAIMPQEEFLVGSQMKPVIPREIKPRPIARDLQKVLKEFPDIKIPKKIVKLISQMIRYNQERRPPMEEVIKILRAV